MAPPPHRPSNASSADERELRSALKGRPRWVKAVWATAPRRLALSIVFLAGGAWILVSALSDPDGFFDHRGSIAGFVAAPLLVLMFGLQAVEAVGDLQHKRDSIPVFHRLGWWLDHRGLPLVGLYVVVMVALLVALID